MVPIKGGPYFASLRPGGGSILRRGFVICVKFPLLSVNYLDRPKKDALMYAVATALKFSNSLN